MNYLFDISPDETGRKRAKKREKTEPPRFALANLDTPTQFQIVLTRGKADGLFECGFCGASAHDVIDEYKGKWKVECCFCGLVETVLKVDGVLPEQPASGDFVFPSGRFAGMTVREAGSTERGVRVLEWLAENSDNANEKDACKKWLDYAATHR